MLYPITQMASITELQSFERLRFLIITELEHNIESL
jgi:hypothetical protein